MVNHGEIGEYRIVAWADGFDPSLDDLLPHVAETIVGHRVVIASWDSGQYRPTQEELDQGWSVREEQAVSPMVRDPSDLPAVGFDEWYIYEGEVPCERHKSFVNRFGFSPLKANCDEFDEFWEQVQRFRPLHVLGAGTPTMFLVTRDEQIYARAVEMTALP
jgi:hypothetical protein